MTSSILKIASFGGFAVAYRQGTADESVLEESFDQDIFFSGVPEYQPRDTDVVIDVGAHIGAFALLAASKIPHGTVHAIEACEDTFNFLRINAALNGMRIFQPITLHSLTDEALALCTTAAQATGATQWSTSGQIEARR